MKRTAYSNREISLMTEALTKKKNLSRSGRVRTKRVYFTLTNKHNLKRPFKGFASKLWDLRVNKNVKPKATSKPVRVHKTSNQLLAEIKTLKEKADILKKIEHILFGI